MAFKYIRQVLRLPKGAVKRVDIFGNVRYFTERYYYEPYVTPFGESVYVRYKRYNYNI